MYLARFGTLIIYVMFVLGGPAGAVLVDKILAAVNGEILTLQDFEDRLALRKIYRSGSAEVDRHQACRHFVDQRCYDRKPCGRGSSEWMKRR
jgi:hypothetical protein